MDNTTILVVAALGYYVWTYKPEWVEHAKQMASGNLKGDCGCGCGGKNKQDATYDQ